MHNSEQEFAQQETQEDETRSASIPGQNEHDAAEVTQPQEHEESPADEAEDPAQDEKSPSVESEEEENPEESETPREEPQEVDEASLAQFIEEGVKAEGEEEPFNIPEILPVLPLKDVVVYPYSVQPLGVGQERSIRLIDDVMRGDRLVVLVAQKSAEIEQAGPDEIFRMGTVSRVGRMFRMPDGTLQIAVQGLERVEIGEFTQEKPYLMAHVTARPDVQESDNETEALKRNVIGYFQRLVALVQNMPEGVAAATLNLEEARQVVYVIATFVQMELAETRNRG